jgi:hypothetical protein
MGWLGGSRVAAIVVLSAALIAADGSTDPQPPVAEHVYFDRLPGDRDDHAVLAALREIDPCALLAAGPKLSGLTLRRVGPRRCELGAAPLDAWVGVSLGKNAEQPERYGGTRVTVAGAKGYRSGFDASCGVLLPVSFRRVIAIETRSGDRAEFDSCTVAMQFATAAVPVLNTARSENGGPLQRWDACTLLDAALGEEVVRYEIRGDAIGSCSTKAHGSPPKSADLTLRFGLDPHTITDPQGGVPGDGRPVRVVSGSECSLAWNVGGSAAPDRVVQVWAADCARTPLLLQAVRTALHRTLRTVAPQHPLLYRPDERDLPQDGACVDFQTTLGGCQPYTGAPAPAGRVELRDDPAVLCGISVAAVARHLTGLSPVEAKGSGCAFVEPDHKRELHITARPAADLPTADMYAFDNPQHITLSGNPGLISNAYDIMVIIDLHVPGGVLHGQMQCLESPNCLAATRDTFADIASTYFS